MQITQKLTSIMQSHAYLLQASRVLNINDKNTKINRNICKERTVDNMFLGTLRCREENTPVLLSASVFDNSGNPPQVAAPRRPREIDQSRQRFHAGYDNRAIFVLTLNHTLPLGHLCICHPGMTYKYVDFKTQKLPTIV